MTGILLCCVLLAILLAALYLVVARPDLVAAWLYRLLRDPDTWLARRLLQVQRPSRYEWLTEVQEAEASQYGDPYPPEAAEAPEPRIVAGSDLDRHRRPIAGVNADFAALAAAPELASLRDLDLTAYYVLPNPEAKQ